MGEAKPIATPYGPSDCRWCGRPFNSDDASCRDEGGISCTSWAVDTLRRKQADLAAQLAEAVGLLRDVHSWTAEGPLRLDKADREKLRAFLARVDGK
jgi:hypothetical protein